MIIFLVVISFLKNIIERIFNEICEKQLQKIDKNMKHANILKLLFRFQNKEDVKIELLQAINDAADYYHIKINKRSTAKPQIIKTVENFIDNNAGMNNNLQKLYDAVKNM